MDDVHPRFVPGVGRRAPRPGSTCRFLLCPMPVGPLHARGHMCARSPTVRLRSAPVRHVTPSRRHERGGGLAV